mmetsp:Transcript_26459/g.71780  ORF Transcript_26459/g.71780 Transcript_26459/m.71780 type:complete len:200 (+) Transcript_26459:581-1180(+)
MMALVSSMTRGTLSHFDGIGSFMECNLSASSFFTDKYSSSTASHFSMDMLPTISSSSHAPISSSPYSSAMNCAKSWSFTDSLGRLPAAPPSCSSSSSNSSSSPIRCCLIALNRARSGRSWSSKAVGPQSMTSAASATPPKISSTTSCSSSNSSYSSAFSSARRTSFSSSFWAGWRASSSLGTWGLASITAPTAPPPFSP